MRKLLLAAALATAAFGMTACASAPPGVTLCAHLQGAGESSDALDPIDKGDAVLTLERTAIHFSIVAPGLEKVVATHIHHGPAGTNGPMLWEINPGYLGDSIRGTASGIPPGVVNLIARDPAEYYVKLHTRKFPGGAIRGQLGPCPPGTRAE